MLGDDRQPIADDRLIGPLVVLGGHFSGRGAKGGFDIGDRDGRLGLLSVQAGLRVDQFLLTTGGPSGGSVRLRVSFFWLSSLLGVAYSLISTTSKLTIAIIPPRRPRSEVAVSCSDPKEITSYVSVVWTMSCQLVFVYLGARIFSTTN